MPECVFCERIWRRDYDFSSDSAVSFEPLDPVVPGHRLFLPVWHVVDARSAGGLNAAMMLAVHYVELRSITDDFNLITSVGPAATQTVSHLHVHFVPRVEGDGLALPWTGQQHA